MATSQEVLKFEKTKGLKILTARQVRQMATVNGEGGAGTVLFKLNRDETISEEKYLLIRLSNEGYAVNLQTFELEYLTQTPLETCKFVTAMADLTIHL